MVHCLQHVAMHEYFLHDFITRISMLITIGSDNYMIIAMCYKQFTVDGQLYFRLVFIFIHCPHNYVIGTNHFNIGCNFKNENYCLCVCSTLTYSQYRIGSNELLNYTDAQIAVKQ